VCLKKLISNTLCSAEPVWFAGFEILSQLQTFQKMVLFAFHNFERSFVDLLKNDVFDVWC